MKIISPSLLNSDTYQIKEQFEALEKCGINYIHIDITDGHFCTNDLVWRKYSKRSEKTY